MFCVLFATRFRGLEASTHIYTYRQVFGICILVPLMPIEIRTNHSLLRDANASVGPTLRGCDAHIVRNRIYTNMRSSTRQQDPDNYKSA